MFRDLLAITETEWNLLLSNWLPDLIFADFYEIFKKPDLFRGFIPRDHRTGKPITTPWRSLQLSSSFSFWVFSGLTSAILIYSVV